MVKPLLLALLLCLVPAPAYAHGIDIPGGLVFGVLWTLVIAIGAACSLSGKGYQRVIYFFSTLAGSAFCSIILMNIIIQLANERGKREAADIYEMLVAGASILAGFIAAVFAHSRMQEQKMMAKPSNRFFCILWIALALVSVLMPYFYGLTASGYGRSFFASTVAPFVSSIAIFIAFVAGFSLKVNVMTDYTFRRLFLYWPFGVLFIMLLCDTNSLLRQLFLQEIVWFTFLIGYPVSAVIFTRKRLKQKRGSN